MRRLVAIALVVGACGGGSEPRAPLASDSPWPKFRFDEAQTGHARVRPTVDPAARPWVFPTGKGIFSSAVIGADETIYIGSADRTFYAIAPDGSERWRVATGEIIDSSALLDDLGRVYFGSGDGHVYALEAATGREVWRFAADSADDTGGYINWFEGNVAIGTDGALYVPNDNRRVYALDRDTGAARWYVTLSDQTWSLPAVDVDTGMIYVGNNNLLPVLGDNTFQIRADGKRGWSTSSLGSVAASPLLVREHGLVVVGGFDGYLRAYRADTGEAAWSLATRDHVYASPALGDGDLVIQPSADGTVYAVHAATGELAWQFDARDPFRSSPAIGGDGTIYIGGGDGHLYALDADGTLRFRMRLIDGERNDLNSSPALGKRGVYLGGESGDVFFVPYDYCLGDAGRADPRCESGSGEELPADGALVYYTTQLGDPLLTAPEAIDPNQALTFSLFVRKAGDTQLALIDEAALAIEVTPATETSIVVSPDRRFATVIPERPFTADERGKVTVRVRGPYLIDPTRTGLRMEGGVKGGDFDASFDFALRAAEPVPPFTVPAAIGDAASAFELYRLAAPLPSILPSYNQIGFDSMSFVGGFVEGNADHAIAWITGAKLDASGATVVDPASKAMFPVVTTQRGGFVTMENRGAFALEALSLRLTFDRFLLSTRVDASGQALVTPTVHVSTPCGGIDFYGEFLRQLGFCNATTDALTVTAAALFRPWGPSGRTTPPTGIGEVVFRRGAGVVEATVTGSSIQVADHALGLLLVDAATGTPVLLGYGLDTLVTAGEGGVVEKVALGTGTKELPAQMRAYLMVDVSAVATAPVAGP